DSIARSAMNATSQTSHGEFDAQNRSTARENDCRRALERQTRASDAISISGTNANEIMPSAISRRLKRPDASSDTTHPRTSSNSTGRRSSIATRMARYDVMDGVAEVGSRTSEVRSQKAEMLERRI